MSVSGVSGSNLLQYQGLQSAQSSFQKFKTEFQQLGLDLQSGNLSQAQADLAALRPSSSASGSAVGTQGLPGSIASAFSQLSQDLQAGNTSSAQQDYLTIKQDLQQRVAGSTAGYHQHNHHHSTGAQDPSTDSESPIQLLLSQLGQALQSGGLATAQSAYTSLQSELAQISGLDGGGSSPMSISPANLLSVSA